MAIETIPYVLVFARDCIHALTTIGGQDPGTVAANAGGTITTEAALLTWAYEQGRNCKPMPQIYDELLQDYCNPTLAANVKSQYDQGKFLCQNLQNNAGLQTKSEALAAIQARWLAEGWTQEEIDCVLF